MLFLVVPARQSGPEGTWTVTLILCGGNEFVCQIFDGTFMASPGCPSLVHLHNSMQPHVAPSTVPWRHADLQQRTYARGARSPGPAWHHSEGSPCRPDPDLASLRKGRDHQQRAVLDRVGGRGGWVAVTCTAGGSPHGRLQDAIAIHPRPAPKMAHEHHSSLGQPYVAWLIA